MRLALAICVLLVATSAACSLPAAPDNRVVRVFAASSLTDAFGALRADFEAANPDIDVQLTFGGSQTLRLQIEQGAPADVFASADKRHMTALAEADLVGASHDFAANELVVIVPAANPAGITTFDDLPRAGRLVIGAPQVPIGAYTRELFSRVDPKFADSVRRRVVSEEGNTRLVRAKIELGEADAAIVYRTDAIAAPGVRIVPVPDAAQVAAHYPIAVLRRARGNEDAERFIRYVLSQSGQDVLADRGFVRGRP